MKALDDCTAIVTGANTGIGRATAYELAQRGAEVILACRSAERADSVLDAIRAAGGRARVEVIDLGDLSSVRASARRILESGRPIDLLINNAGLAGHRGITRDGFELAFGTNHLGHFLLTVLLMSALRAARAARIVNVSSVANYDARGINFGRLRRPTRSLTGLPEYAVSKLANVLFTKELSRRLGSSRVRSFAVDPGVVASDIWRRVPWPVRPIWKRFMLSTEEGARTTLHCATSPESVVRDGAYYVECREQAPNVLADDEDLAKALWRRSVEWAGADLEPIIGDQRFGADPSLS